MYAQKRWPVGFCTLLLAFASLASRSEAAERPNILLILADDMGFSDLGCYGGDVETPNLDGLASHGLRFTQFYNTARCWPSRAAILTGYYAQQVHRDAIPGLGGGGGVQNVRPKWAPLLPQFLRPLGYRSYLSGKWHVDGLPSEGGFDHSYVLHDHDRNFNPKNHLEDDRPLPPVEPDSGYYTTIAIADHAIKCLREHAEKHADRPFFQYLAFTCPHFPLQALSEDVAHYRDRYREGWDVIRQRRWERMKKLGIVNCALSERTAGVPAWDTLSSDEQAQWQMRMAVHAAMVDRMDREIGRVIALLKANGSLDNTIVLFLSDNGASAEKVLRGDGHDPSAPPGSARTFQCLEPGWANVANAPLRRSKIFVHEGGIATPLIVRWPKGIAGQGQLRHTPGHVIDCVPTLLSLIGSEKPAQWQGSPPPAAPGRNLKDVLADDRAVERDCLWWFHSGNRAIRAGDWKLVSAGDGDWELYNLATDRCESNNLAESEPEKVKQLERQWTEQLAEFRKLAEQP